MKITDNHVFFWEGPLSNWAPGDFKVSGVTYNCVEQYMMASKAKLFNDWKSYKQIMLSSSPKEQKKLGREVSNFDNLLWVEVRYNIVRYGILQKYSSDSDRRKYLLSFGKRAFAEASPFDKIWGIGMDEGTPGIDDPHNWKGENLLGQILTNVRDILISY